MTHDVKRCLLCEIYNLIKNIRRDLSDIKVVDICIGKLYVGVRTSDNSVGLALNFGERTSSNSTKRLLMKLSNKNVTDVIKLHKNNNLLCTAVSVATLNALSQKLIANKYLRRYGLIVKNKFAQYPLGYINKGDIVAIVGFGGPLFEIVEKSPASKIYVTEMRPLEEFYSLSLLEGKLVEDFTDTRLRIYSAEDNKKILPRADVVFITGSALANNTMNDLLNYCKNARNVIIYGISASIFPIPLFRRGVSHINTIKIHAPIEAIKSLHNYGYRGDSWIRRNYAHEINIVKKEFYNSFPVVIPYKKVRINEIDRSERKQALIIVDMVNDFLHPDGQLFCGKQARNIIPFVKKIMHTMKRKRGLIIFLRESHEKNEKEFWFYKPHCIKGSWGYEIIEELPIQYIDYIIEKSTPNGCLKTPLNAILRKEKVKDVFIVGVSTSICVMETACALKYRGYNVFVLRNGVADSNRRFHSFALKRMKMLGIHVI